MRLAIVGGGWAGLAAAVEAAAAGHTVSLFEMAPTLGGRARRLEDAGLPGLAVDNGQHLLIGAYVDSLRLMRLLGVDPDQHFRRLPLVLQDARGQGLRLPAGAPLLAFVRGVLAVRHWPLRDRLALLRTAARWRAQGFRCPPSATVEALCDGLPASVMDGLIRPLCVAALNTPTAQASGQVWLNVLRDALFAGPGAADLLLPRTDLGALLPDAAARWLEARGMPPQRGARVTDLHGQAGAWTLHLASGATAHAEAVILAASPVESARLAEPHAPAWSAQARALPYEAIVTVLVRAPGASLARPMVVLDEGPGAPAQIVFDLGQLRDPEREPGARGCFAAVVSGARAWLDGPGLAATGPAVARQLAPLLGEVQVLRCLAEKRATLCCRPALARPPAWIAPGLAAAGDHVEGPYPSTLEGAVRSGVQALRLLHPSAGSHES